MKTILVALLLTGAGFAQTTVTNCTLTDKSVSCTTQEWSVFVAIEAGRAKHLLTKQTFCLEIANQKDFHGYTRSNSWCPQFMYDHPLAGVLDMTDEQLAASQRTCEARKLKGSYKVRSPNGKENDNFACGDLADAIHEGWNKQ